MAGMLLALPYESNAIIGIVVGASLISFGIGLLIGYLAEKNAENNVHIDYNASIIGDRYESYFEKWREIGNNTDGMQYNLMNLSEMAKLYFQRIAERRAIDIVDKMAWNETLEDYVAQDFDNYTKQLLEAYLIQDTNYIYDLIVELNSLADYEFDNTNSFAKGSRSASGGTLIEWGTFYNSGWKHYVISENYLYFDDGYTYTRKILDNNETAFYILNVSHPNFNIKEFFSSGKDLTIKWVDDNPATGGDHYVRTNKIFTGTNDYPFKIYYRNDLGKTWNYRLDDKYQVNLGQKYDDLRIMYNNLRQVIVNSAYSYWNWLHEMGYYNQSEIPDDYIPVYPDNWLENINLLNMTNEEAHAFFMSIMKQFWEQMNERIENNQTDPVTWDDIVVGNFSNSTMFRITYRKANFTLGDGDIIINNTWAWIIPLEHSITLEVNKTYALTKANKPAWADYKYEYALAIFVLHNRKYYYYEPQASSDMRNLTIHEILKNNQSINNISFDMVSANDFAFRYFGFTFTDSFTNPPNIPTSDDSDWLSWLTEHKGLIVIACIFSGIILTASSRKGTGGHTIGIILLVAGVGLAFYWYILPAINGVTSFLDKLTFWD